jgi:hypothetical protein
LCTSSTDEELKHFESTNFQTDISVFEVNTVLKELKNKKSPDSDGIGLELFKYVDGNLNMTWRNPTIMLE